MPAKDDPNFISDLLNEVKVLKEKNEELKKENAELKKQLADLEEKVEIRQSDKPDKDVAQKDPFKVDQNDC